MAGVEQDVRAATINGMTRDELLDTITAHYLKDNEEFNGLRVASTGLTDTELKAVLRQLVAEELGSLHLGPHPNPYIKGFPAHPPGAQLAALDQLDDLAHLVVYPERRHLEQVVDPDAYAGRPYTLRMALGDPQLAPVFFDLSVLERYRNDPRYHYRTDDLGGFKWSLQRLVERSCDGQAGWVDDGVDGSGADEVAGDAVASTRCGAVVLA